MIQINPLKSYIDGGVRAALTTPPSASLVFDLPGKAIWVKGVKLKGTDHTYTFSHDNYITLTNTPDSNESEDIKIGVNTSALKSAIDTTYGVVSTTANGLAPKFTSGNKQAASAATTYYFLGWTGTTLKWYQAPFRNIRINSETTDRLGVNSTDPLIISSGNGISVTWDSTNKKIVITNTKPDVNHNTDRTGIKLATVSGTKKTDSTLILANSTTGLNIQGGTNKFLIGDGTNYIEVPIVPSFTVTNKDATIGTALTTIATIAGVDIKAKIASYSLSNHTHSVKINGSTKTIAASGAVDLGNYLPLSGGTMGGTAWISWPDSGNWSNSNSGVTFPVTRGGLQWSGQSDYIKLFSEETGNDNLNLVLQFGDDNSNGLSIRNKSNVQTSHISSSGVITTGTFKGNLDWSYITNKPSSYTPSAHTHAWNSLTHSSTTENQAILTNGKANGWKLYTLNISGWNNAANNAHSHSNKSVLDGITSALVNSWNTAYNFVNTITGTDTDKVINKWDEIVNFLAGITEDDKLNTLLNNKLSIQQLSTKDILTTKTNNALFWVNTISTASSITTGPFTDYPYALLSVTNYIQNDTNGKFFYRSRLAFSSTGDLKVASCHHQGEYKQDDIWYNVLTSKNSGINGSTIKLNGTSITVYSSSTADGRFVKKTGDTMSGALNLANNTWNKIGDDSYIGDCNKGGMIGIKTANTTYPGIAFFDNTNTHLGNLIAYSNNIKYKTYSLQFLDNGNTNVSAGTWMNPFSTYNVSAVADGQAICVWGQSSYLSNLAADSGDMSLWLKRVSAKSATLNMVLDGEYYANGNQRLAHVSEIPNSLKNPHALTISLNGTSQGPYDGSAAKNINITPNSIGASSSSHTHAYLPLSGGTMTGNITYKGKGTSYIGNGENDAANGVGGALNNLVISSWYGISFTTSCSGQTYTNKNAVSINCRNGYVYANTFVGAFSGNSSSATKLTSSAGNAVLPIYFSDGKPVACTASSLFSNLSNSGNNISITVAGQNRTLQVGYSSNSDKVDNRHAISTTPNTGIIYKAAIYTSSSLTSYWVRLASIPSISQNSEFIATIHVQSGHSNPGRSAILLVYLRGSASSFMSKSFKICCNSNYDPNRFRLYYKDSDKTSEIWYQTTGQWDGIITTIISQSSEGSLYEGLTLYSGSITAVQTPSMSTYLSAQVSTITDNISGNASTATKLQTARQINGTNFDGTSNITTSYWGTTRTLTIGNSGKSVNGSTNISWSLSEIGAADVNHTHDNKYLRWLGNAGQSNMNAIGRISHSSGMTNLSDPGNNTDNPMEGSSKSASWHLYWQTNYTDDPNGSNAWVAQIVNKAGTDRWWVRSRSGGTITNGTSWTSNWRFLVTAPTSGIGSGNQPIYINNAGEVVTANSYPTSLKNPYLLTLKANGTTLATYDGSSAKEVNFTYANVGAASASHTHSYITISTCSTLDENSNNFSVEYASGSNSVITKPSGVDAFGVMKLRTASGWYGQILMSNSKGIYYRSANGLTSSVNWIKLLDSSNSNVSGGGNAWGSSITININGTSKTLTIPGNPNTDYRVTQSETTTANYRPLVLGYTNISTAGSGMTGSVTNQVYLSNKFYVQPSTGNLYATNFVGTLSGNATTATTLQTARTIWGQSFNGSNNVSGNMSGVGQITFSSLTGTNGRALLYQQMADNDFFRIYVGATASNAGYAEIATADDGNEPIYVRQYSGVFSTLKRTLTLLDGNGNTILPGFTTATGFKKNGSTDNYVLLGGGGHKIISDFMLKTDEISNNLTIISKSLTVTQAWMDTGIKNTDLPANGTYIIQVSANNTADSIYSNYWSGIMSWYTGGTNDSEADEIILHRAGHAYHHTIYLRTIMTVNSDGRHLRLQIAADTNLSTAVTYTFKFKRVI